MASSAPCPRRSPVPVRDPETRCRIRRVEVLLPEVSHHAYRLRHVDGLHVDLMQAEHFTALEPDHEALQFLSMHGGSPPFLSTAGRPLNSRACPRIPEFHDTLLAFWSSKTRFFVSRSYTTTLEFSSTAATFCLR